MTREELKNARESIVEFVNVFANKKGETGLHRYSSWEYCYGVAQCMYERKAELTENDYDYMALQLGFYLASWGMYRNSFLLDRSYKIHIKVLKAIFANDDLWKKDNVIPSETFTEFGRTITVAYGLNLNDFNKNSNSEVSEISVTDTLFTKILLGITGNVIAYDRYCKNALGFFEYGWKFFRKRPRTSWDKLLDDISFFEEVFKDIDVSYPIYKFENGLYVETGDKAKYPTMKLLDMFLFNVGILHTTINCGKAKENEKIKQDFFENGLSPNNKILLKMQEEHKRAKASL